MEENSNKEQHKIGRREIIKGLATVPVIGAFFYAWYRKRKYDNLLKSAIQEEIKLDQINPVFNRKVSNEKQIG